MRPKHSGGVKSGLRVGAQIVDEIPQVESILESVRGQNGFDGCGSETMTCTAPQGCQAELSIGVHGRTFQ